MAHRDIEAEIERLNLLRNAAHAEAAAGLRKALGDRANLVIAKAARLAAELGCRDLVPDLLRAFDRLMENGATRDPQCWGKNALASVRGDWRLGNTTRHSLAAHGTGCRERTFVLLIRASGADLSYRVRPIS